MNLRTKIYAISTVILIGIIILSVSQTTPYEEKSFNLFVPLSPDVNVTVKTRLECTLPVYIRQVPILIANKPETTEIDIIYIAKTFAGFKGDFEIIDSLMGAEVHRNGYDLIVDGKNNFMLSNTIPTTEINTLSDEETIKVAEIFVDKVMSYLIGSSCTSVFDEIKDGDLTILEGEKTVHTKAVIFKIRYENILITGNGAEIRVNLCNGKLVSFEVHVPYVQEVGVKQINVSPSTALHNYLGNPSVSSWAYKESQDKQLDLEKHINNVELVYHYNFLQTHFEVTSYYVVSGNDVLLDDGSIVRKVPFMVSIPAIN